MLQVFLSLINEGGWVLWPIFAVSVLAWYIGIEKLLLLRKIKRARQYFLTSIGCRDVINRIATTGQSSNAYVENIASPYVLLLGELKRGKAESPKHREYLFREFLATVVPDLEHGLSTMSACVTIAPLLGLLGTITGMNKMFAIITEFGLGSPSLMAGGIGVALESALTGLLVAVAAMFFHNYLYNKKNDCVRLLMKDGETLVNSTFPVAIASPHV